MAPLKPSWYTYAVLAATLVVVVLVVGSSASPTPAPAPVTASSTLQVIPSTPSPTTPVATPTAPAPADSSKSPTPALQPAPVPGKIVKPVEPQQPAAAPVTEAQVTAAVSADLNAASAALRAALVNIICYAPAGSSLHSISGSGVIIDPKGVILTNAHIAQYFLLADRGVSCKVRTGSPATDEYGAGLIYIPPLWINTNAKLLTSTSPSGTGEYDFALVGITRSLTSSPLPATYPSMPLAKNALVAGAPVVIGSYGAQFLDYSQIQSDLFPTIVFGSVKDIYTFATNSIDVFALGGSAAAQEGSSGGGVVNALGELAGTITTSTMEGPTSSRELDAISAAYIRREYGNETGGSLDSLLSTSISDAVAGFATAAYHLEQTLTAALP